MKYSNCNYEITKEQVKQRTPELIVQFKNGKTREIFIGQSIRGIKGTDGSRPIGVFIQKNKVLTEEDIEWIKTTLFYAMDKDFNKEIKYLEYKE